MPNNMRQYKALQDKTKTKQDKRKQYKTRKDTTRQYATILNIMRQD